MVTEFIQALDGLDVVSRNHFAVVEHSNLSNNFNNRSFPIIIQSLRMLNIL